MLPNLLLIKTAKKSDENYVSLFTDDHCIIHICDFDLIKNTVKLSYTHTLRDITEMTINEFYKRFRFTDLSKPSEDGFWEGLALHFAD